MKYLTRLIKFLVWIVALMYFMVIVLTHVPFVQERMGQELSSLVSKELGTYCSIERVNLGFLNRVIIDGVVIRDKNKKDMLKAKRIAVTPDFFELLNGKVTISAAQLFGADIAIYKDTEDGQLNCQFAIDSLSKPQKEPSKLDVRINSLILRNANVSYDLNYKPYNPKAFLDANHIHLSGLKANLSLTELKEKDIELQVKKLAFAEQNGLKVENLSCNFSRHKDIVKLKRVDLALDDGFLYSDSIVVNLENKHLRCDFDARYRELNAKAKVVASKEAIILSDLNLYSDNQKLKLLGKGELAFGKNGSVEWDTEIHELKMDAADLNRTLSENFGVNIGTLPSQLTQAGQISFKGRTNGLVERFTAKGQKLTDILDGLTGNLTGELTSSLGDANLDIQKGKELLKANISTEKLMLGTILGDSRFNIVSADIETSVPASILKNLNGGISLTNHPDVSLKANVRQFDYDGKSFKDVQADLSLSKSLLVGTLTSAAGNLASFDADMNLDISHLNEKRLLGYLNVKDFKYENIALNNIKANFKENAVYVDTDLGNVSLTGDIDQKRLNSVVHLNDIAQVDKLLGLGLDAKGVVDADVQIIGDSISGVVMSPELQLSSVELKNVNTSFAKHGQHIDSSIKLENGEGKTKLLVALNSSINLHKDATGKVTGVDAHILPSKAYLGDLLFVLPESDVAYNNKMLEFDNFTIRHGQQHVIINGKASKDTNDSILVDINDIDVPYVMDLVNFHSVTFEGKASGKAVVRQLFTTPEAEANIQVDNFLFEHGRMGTLYANGVWNNDLSQIDVEAYCDDEGRLTKISGFISPTRNCLNLDIDANNTRAECVGHFCQSFFSDVDVTVNGNLCVWGDFRFVNLTGLVNVDGALHVKALGTDYTLKNQTVELVPNDIVFVNDTVYDKYGKMAVVNGSLHHQYLSRLSYDLDVKPYNLLSYDFPSYGNQVFYGKAFATGDCKISGRPGSVTFDIDCKTEKGSFFEYNASNPDAITGQQFINWRDRTAQNYIEERDMENAFSADIRMNVNAHLDDDFALRVLMDSKSGDKITLHGDGDLRATYYNKGKFEIYGNYLVNSGTYTMTIQNLLERKFQFQEGSQIVFGGEPYDAALSLKAKYPVNGVPLSDLQIGNSFKNNNVHVDCLMDIKGTPNAPRVDFDFDLPTVNSDAKAMIESLMNSEQEKNQQVLYLLAIGRFYSQETAAAGNDTERQSQTSLAMQSFLSGTLSQQINNALGSVTKNNNWNIGANISPGDEGFNNAEYEGIVSGSLLNNRLLINGQFGYRDKPNATSSFIGDFDVRYLLVPSGNIAVRVYNQSNDRYFTRSSLNTQGIGMIFRYDFQKFLGRFRDKLKNRLNPKDAVEPKKE